MASMRVCAACNRPNGPHFSRCMSCGHWLGPASVDDGGPTDSADAARRAVRLLESMTPERRNLLPAPFLRSVQMQARGMKDAQGDSGIHPAIGAGDLPSAEEPAGSTRPVTSPSVSRDAVSGGHGAIGSIPKPEGPTTLGGRRAPVEVTDSGRRIVPPSTGRMRAVRRSSFDPPSAIGLRKAEVTSGFHDVPTTETGRHRALEIPEKANPHETTSVLDAPLDIDEDADTVMGEPALMDEAGDLERSSLEVELPAVGEAGTDSLDPLWEDSASVRAMAVVAPDEFDEDDPTQMISVLDDFPDILDDDKWGGPLVGTASNFAGHEEPDFSANPFVHALTSGRGPFGDREARFRLVMIPNLAYAANEENLRLALNEAVQMDLYTARLTLKKPFPVLLASSDDPRELNNQARDLRLAGLEVLLLERGYWLDGILPLEVAAMRGPAPGPVTFSLQGGEEETVQRERFGYCVLGVIDDKDGKNVWILDLYMADAPVCARIRSDRFDFSCLGDLAAGPVARRMPQLVRWLSLDPSVPLPLDEDFKHLSPASRSVKSASPEIEPGLVDFTEYSLICDQGRRVG